jgi:hypothetical protein
MRRSGGLVFGIQRLLFMRPSQIRNLIVLAVSLLVLGWADHDSRQFHHRVQMVERNRTSQYVDQHAVVQHRPCRRGCPGGFHRAMGGSRAGIALCGSRPRNSRLYSRLVTVVLAIVAIVFASASIDYWTVMSFFGSRGIALAS